MPNQVVKELFVTQKGNIFEIDKFFSPKDIDVGICKIGKDLITCRALLLEKLEGVQKVGTSKLFKVDPALKAGNEAAKVFKNGKYELNPTATTINELTINPSGTVKGKK